VKRLEALMDFVSFLLISENPSLIYLVIGDMLVTRGIGSIHSSIITVLFTGHPSQV